MSAESDRAWAAGLFEGEGTVTACNGRPRLAVKMVEEESVQRFRSVVGLGTVYGPYGPYESDHSRRPHWLWVADGAEAVRVGELLEPLVSVWVRERLLSQRASFVVSRETRGGLTPA